MIIGSNYTPTYSNSMPSFKGISPKPSVRPLGEMATTAKQESSTGDAFVSSSSADEQKHYIRTKDGILKVGKGRPSESLKTLSVLGKRKSNDDLLKEEQGTTQETVKATERDKALSDQLRLLQLQNLPATKAARAKNPKETEPTPKTPSFKGKGRELLSKASTASLKKLSAKAREKLPSEDAFVPPETLGSQSGPKPKPDDDFRATNVRMKDKPRKIGSQREGIPPVPLMPNEFLYSLDAKLTKVSQERRSIELREEQEKMKQEIRNYGGPKEDENIEEIAEEEREFAKSGAYNPTQPLTTETPPQSPNRPSPSPKKEGGLKRRLSMKLNRLFRKKSRKD